MSLMEQPWGLLAIAFAVSFFWRAAGAIVAGRIAVDTPLFDWCVCITQAIVGGLMVRALLLPSTGLAAVPLIDRIGATLLGLAIFILLRWRILPGVLAGVLTLAGLILWRAG